MNRRTEVIRTYLAEHSPDYGTPIVHSMLDFLWLEYGEYNLLENDLIKENHSALHPFLNRLPRVEADQLFSIIVSLCAEHERLAFIEGARIGMRLALELEAVE